MREYRFIDPDNLDTSDVPIPEGPKVKVLADALLDVIQLSLDRGFTQEEVDEALSLIHEERADMARASFRLVLPEDDSETE